MPHTIRLAAALLAALFLWTPVAAPAAPPKDYAFPEVRIAIAIERDGSFLVEERRTYEFSGSFSWADLTIPSFFDRAGRSYAIRVEDFTVAEEDGRPLRIESGTDGGSFKAKWFYSARDERRTFLIRYRVRDAISSYPEVSELYWKAIGDAWIKPTARAEVVVTLPSPLLSMSDMLVYGHGPLTGVSEIVDARTARFAATDIRAGQFLEIRVVWPAGIVDGVPATGMNRAAIMAEEARFVQETIEGGNRARAAADRGGRGISPWLVVWLAWLLVGPLAFLAVYIPQWRRRGREYDVPNAPEYFHEPPSNLPPALVEHLRSQAGQTSPRAFTATIFDLARRGYIHVEDRRVEKAGLFGTKEKTETRLTLVEPKAHAGSRRAGDPARPFELEVLAIVFGRAAGGSTQPGDSLTIDELKAWLIKHSSDFRSWFKAWSKDIKEEGKALGFLEPESLKLRKVVGLPFFLSALLTFNVPLIILAGILAPKLARNTRAWVEEAARWKALEKFLKDFGEFKDLPPQAYVLWESYLVFGILFGQAPQDPQGAARHSAGSAGRGSVLVHRIGPCRDRGLRGHDRRLGVGRFGHRARQRAGLPLFLGRGRRLQLRRRGRRRRRRRRGRMTGGRSFCPGSFSPKMRKATPSSNRRGESRAQGIERVYLIQCQS